MHQCISASLNLLHLRSATSKTPLSYISHSPKTFCAVQSINIQHCLKVQRNTLSSITVQRSVVNTEHGLHQIFPSSPFTMQGGEKLSSFGVNCRLMFGVDSTLLSNEVCVELLWCAVELDHLGVQKRITKALVCSRAAWCVVET